MTNLTVSVQWLNQHLNEVIVCDCRFALTDAHLGRQQYELGHIPGAYYLDLNRDLSSPVQQHGGRHPLPDPEAFAATIAKTGISRSTIVVAYDDSRCAFAARLWWLLRYFGHDQVAILDGGFKAWQNAGYPTTSVIPEPKSGQFTPRSRSDWIVTIEAVKAKKDLPNVALIDSREAERYRGEREPIDPIAGHIEGAINFPWQAVTTEKGYVRPIEELRDRWSALQAKDEILVYCGSGVTACVNLFALAAAGIETGKLYAGSWSDWCSYLIED